MIAFGEKVNMKRKYTLPIFMFLIVVAISFIVFLNKAFSVGTTIYHDWSAIEKIDENYSYSTLFRSSNTIIKEMKKAGAYNSEYSSSLFNRDNIKPGDELIVLITNCATNKNGELLDVVVKINNVKNLVMPQKVMLHSKLDHHIKLLLNKMIRKHIKHIRKK